MATTRSFNDMLNEYLAYDLLAEEQMKRDWLLSNVEKDNDWKGGTLVVPFKGAMPSSYRYGKLTAQSDISEHKFVRGTVSGYKEIWGTMKWNARDLVEHSGLKGQSLGMVSEQSFLKALPETIEEFVDGMKQVVSVNLLSGNHFTKLTADSTANDGVVTVDHAERFQIGQKVIVDDDNSVAITAYVKTIDINANQAVLVTARGGATVIDFSANNMTTAQNAKVYVEGAETAADAFTSLRSQLLPAAQGGSSTLFGQTKLAYPYLQAVAQSGAAITASNILDKLFDAWTRVMNVGKGHATVAVMSYKHLGSIMKQLELGSGSFRHVETKVNVYGYTEIVITGVKGSLKVVGVHEMDDDVIYFLDWKALKLYSNGYFRKQVDPEGKAYYVVREETGYTYICDIAFFGELVVHKPSHCGVIYSISY